MQCNAMLLCVAYSPLVAMMPRAMKALRLTSLLLCAMSIQRGSRAPRPSRATLFSSPDNRGSQRTGKLSTAARRRSRTRSKMVRNKKVCGLKKRKRRLDKVGVLCNQIIAGVCLDHKPFFFFFKCVQVIRVLSIRGQLHLYLQKCGWPRRL